MNHRLPRACLFAALIVALTACSELLAGHTMVATVLQTPTLSVPPQAIAGLDASIPDGGFAFLDAGSWGFDGGFPFDAGVSFGGGVPIPGQALAHVFFGTLPTLDQSKPPAGVPGATVTAGAEGGTTYTLKDLGSGNYALSSAENTAFAYESGKKYVFNIAHSGVSYKGTVLNAPTLEVIPELHPALGYIDLPARTSFTLKRPAPPSGQSERNIAFVTVVPVSVSGNQGNPTYTNFPNDPFGILKLFAVPIEFKKETFVIPASAFPEADKNYLIIFTTAKTGAGGPNINIFSAIAVGSADVGIVKTR